jgi:hypothetical protein
MILFKRKYISAHKAFLKYIDHHVLSNTFIFSYLLIELKSFLKFAVVYLVTDITGRISMAAREATGMYTFQLRHILSFKTINFVYLK